MNKAKKAEDIEILTNFLSQDLKFGTVSVIKSVRPLNSKETAEIRFSLAEKNIILRKVKSSILKKVNTDLNSKGDIFVMFDKNCSGMNIIQKFNTQYSETFEVVAAINQKHALKSETIKILGGYECQKMIYNSLVGILMSPMVTLVQIFKQIGEKKC